MLSPLLALPRVTAGVPVRNGARFLEKRLENLCALDYPDLEILVSDDASTDGSVEIAESWARRDSRIRVTSRTQPLGAGANFGWLMERASGRHFFLAAQDDWHEPGFVRETVAVLEQDPRLWGVAVRWKFMDDDDKPVDWPAKDSFLPDTRTLSWDQKIRFFTHGPAGFHLYTLWRIEPILGAGIRMETHGTYPFYEYPWILGLLLRGEVAKIEKDLFTYRLHLGSKGGPPDPAPGSPGVAIAAGDWNRLSDAEKSLRFYLRYREVVAEWAGSDEGRKKRGLRALRRGMRESAGASIDWYARSKQGLLAAWKDALWARDQESIRFYSLMLGLKIKPLRFIRAWCRAF